MIDHLAIKNGIETGRRYGANWRTLIDVQNPFNAVRHVSVINELRNRSIDEYLD